MMPRSDYKHPNVVKIILNYICSPNCAMLNDPLKTLELTRAGNTSKGGIAGLAQVLSLSLSCISFLLPCPSPFFTLKGTPQGSFITVAAFTGVNWVSLGLLEDPGWSQPSPANRSWRAGQLTLNWGLELPAAGWIWPCKAQDAFFDLEQPGGPPGRPQIWPLKGWQDRRG